MDRAPSGGLAMAAQAACAVFGAISGCIFAATVAIGSIAIPEMKRYNYNKRLATTRCGGRRDHRGVNPAKYYPYVIRDYHPKSHQNAV